MSINNLLFRFRIVNTTLFSTTYSSTLSNRSQTICRTGTCSGPIFYFEALLLNIAVTGSYRIFSQSSMDTFGYLYNRTFDPTYMSVNLILSDDDGYGNRQFLLSSILEAGGTFIAVATTYSANITGAFSVIATGPGPIGITKINATSELFILVDFSRLSNYFISLISLFIFSC